MGYIRHFDNGAQKVCNDDGTVWVRFPDCQSCGGNGFIISKVDQKPLQCTACSYKYNPLNILQPYIDRYEKAFKYFQSTLDELGLSIDMEKAVIHPRAITYVNMLTRKAEYKEPKEVKVEII